MKELEEEESAVSPIECLNQVNLGETGVGKTFQNAETIKIYLRPNRDTGKKPMKVLILNFQNEDAYSHYKTLPPTREAVIKFVQQKTIEARQITPIAPDGHRLTKGEKLKILGMVADTFKQGMILYDDIDAYAAFASSAMSSKKDDDDLIGALMGNRHKGLDQLFSHQAWGKIGMTEAQNLTLIRLHYTSDNVLAIPASKRENLPVPLCMIATYIVNDQYKLVNNLYKKGKLTEKEWKAYKSFHVYVNVRSKRIYPVSEENFRLAARKLLIMNEKMIKEEVRVMLFEEVIQENEKNSLKTEKLAMKRLIDRYVEDYWDCPENHKRYGKRKE